MYETVPYKNHKCCLFKFSQYGLFEAHPANSVLHSICAVRSACKFVACTRAGEVFEVSKDRWFLSP